MDDRVVRSNDRPFPDDTVLQPLVITLFVGMRHVLHDRTTQRRLPNENQLGQTLFLGSSVRSADHLLTTITRDSARIKEDERKYSTPSLTTAASTPAIARTECHMRASCPIQNQYSGSSIRGARSAAA